MTPDTDKALCWVLGCDEPAERISYNTCREPPLAMHFCIGHEKRHKYGDTMTLKPDCAKPEPGVTSKLGGGK